MNFLTKINVLEGKCARSTASPPRRPSFQVPLENFHFYKTVPFRPGLSNGGISLNVCPPVPVPRRGGGVLAASILSLAASDVRKGTRNFLRCSSVRVNAASRDGTMARGYGDGRNAIRARIGRS